METLANLNYYIPCELLSISEFPNINTITLSINNFNTIAFNSAYYQILKALYLMRGLNDIDMAWKEAEKTFPFRTKKKVCSDCDSAADAPTRDDGSFSSGIAPDLWMQPLPRHVAEISP